MVQRDSHFIVLVPHGASVCCFILVVKVTGKPELPRMTPTANGGWWIVGKL
jgi:hypothetical protein